MQHIDLTHEIAPDMPVYPGTDPPVFEIGSSIEKDGFLEKKLTLFSHTGTHMDAPAHIIPDGRALDRYPVSHFAGQACVIDVCNSAMDHISVDLLAASADRIRMAQFVLLRSGWDRHWGTPGYFSGYPVLSPEAARWLTREPAHLKGIRVDMISVDPVDAADLEIHKILLGAGLVLIENLANLDSLPDTLFDFSCYPLRIKRADGAPVRAVAIVEA